MGGPRLVGVTGPLEVFEAGYVSELTGTGHVARVVQLQVQLMAELSRWLEGQGVEASGLGVDVAERFMADRRAAGLEPAEGDGAFQSSDDRLATVGRLEAQGAIVVTRDTFPERTLPLYWLCDADGNVLDDDTQPPALAG